MRRRKKSSLKNKLLSILKDNIIPILTMVSVLFLSIGFSALRTNVNLELEAYYEPQTNVRLTNLISLDLDSGGTYTKDSVNLNVAMPNSDSEINYTVEITNFGNVEVGLYDLLIYDSSLDDYISLDEYNATSDYPLNIEITDYDIKDMICDDNDDCINGISKNVNLQLTYKSNAYSLLSNYNFDLNIKFVFKQMYNVTYEGLVLTDPPSKVIGSSIFSVDLEDNEIGVLVIYMNNLLLESNEYTYNSQTHILTINKPVDGNISIRPTGEMNVIYENMSDMQADNPQTIMEFNTLDVDFSEYKFETVRVYMSGHLVEFSEESCEYIKDAENDTYELILYNVTGNVTIKGYYKVEYTNFVPTTSVLVAQYGETFTSVLSPTNENYIVKMNDRNFDEQTLEEDEDYQISYNQISFINDVVITGDITISALFKINYHALEATSDLPTEIDISEQLIIDLGENTYTNLVVVMGGNKLVLNTDYTLSNNILTISNLTGDIDIGDTYTVTYVNIATADSVDYAFKNEEGRFAVSTIYYLSVIMGGNELNDYTTAYNSNNHYVVINNVTGNVVIERIYKIYYNSNLPHDRSFDILSTSTSDFVDNLTGYMCNSFQLCYTGFPGETLSCPVELNENSIYDATSDTLTIKNEYITDNIIITPYVTVTFHGFKHYTQYKVKYNTGGTTISNNATPVINRDFNYGYEVFTSLVVMMKTESGTISLTPTSSKSGQSAKNYFYYSKGVGYVGYQTLAIYYSYGPIDIYAYVSISYSSVNYSSGLPSRILSNESLDIYLTNDNHTTYSVVMNSVTLTEGVDYTYDSNTKHLVIPELTGDITITGES